MTKRKDRIITFIFVLVIIVLINAIVNQFTPFIDLTKDKIYSLSSGSKSLVKSLKEPLSVKFFLTPNLPPPFSTYEKYIKDLFAEYKSAAGKNISFEIIDASTNTTMANQYGISSTQINVLEKDQTSSKIAYMGLAFIENNLNVYYISSPEVYELLPIGAMELIPDSIMQAVTEANKNLMNKVIFTHIDMSSPNKENEDIIKKLNIKKLEWQDIKDNDGTIIVPKGSGYFSLVLENGDNILELSTSSILYGDFAGITDEISKSIDSMLGLKANIGYIEGHNEPNTIDIPVQYGGNPDDAYISASRYASEIEANYNFQPINLDTQDIPSTMDALVVLGSVTPFSDAELYKLDQFIMSGKPVLFMLNGAHIDENDPNAQMYGPRLTAVTNRLNEILPSYGLYLAENMIFDDNAYRAQLQEGMPEQKIYYIPLIMPENINSKSDITKSINLMLAPLSSEVLISSNDTKITPLFYSSDKSWIETNNITSSMNGMPKDSNLLSKRLIAAISQGNMTSAFDGKDIPINSTNINIANVNRLNSTTSGRVIIVGSADMARNSAFDANKIFLMNMIDYMVGDTALMDIRRKGAIFNPPYQVPESIKMAVRFINIVVVPFIVILFGVMLWRRDKNRRKKIFEKFNNGEKK